jgi:hypothetical protein
MSVRNQGKVAKNIPGTSSAAGMLVWFYVLNRMGRFVHGAVGKRHKHMTSRRLRERLRLLKTATTAAEFSSPNQSKLL